ncbi:metalloprotease PmbA [Candidatus Macondimonas diazotrophica]|uniref:Metalloprotease PmbA n=1 Tax=Candidatus Macondimonas diazotrophica TaxID=2305248 RepID=A0A4Z0FEB8_9GAMM|nr:metalloprotease PmbA [Candidatus Macondimonas diazotrophica]TFZ84243.1 metalloprotease PmbA [Candidatus Macondimonas diazotrophica]HBG51401.1 metalloprotease PmbA [Gammaproteobacteria bacterium]
MEAAVERALACARSGGADAVQAEIGLRVGYSVSVRSGEVETLEHERDRGLGITVYFGQRKGAASTTDLRPEAIDQTVKAACDLANHTEADPAAGLPDPGTLAWTIPELDLYHPWALTPEEAIERALAMEAAALDADPRVKSSEGAGIQTGLGISVLANSQGFRGVRCGSSHGLGLSVVTQASGQMQRDGWYESARLASRLPDAEAVGRHAAERALARLGARALSSRSVPVLFAPEVARSLIRHFVGAVSGGSLYRQMSFLQDKLGQQIMSPDLHVHEQPHLPQAMASAAFDGEGVATSPRDLVRDGLLAGYVLDSYSARRLGLRSTGNAGGVHNLAVAPTCGGGEAEMLRLLDTGLWVTELMGQGVNLVTGDYSRGAAGFWVERGQVVHAVEEVTIAGNLADLYRRIVAVGDDVDARGSIHCGSILVESMTVAGDGSGA